MDSALKHRLIGAAVLSALAIIFLPMLIVGKDPNDTASKVPLKVPAAPAGDFETKELPLAAPASGVPDGGVVGMNTSHPAAASPANPASPAASPGMDGAAVATASPASPASGATPAAASPAITPSTTAAASPASPKSPATAPVAAASPGASPKSPATAAVQAPVDAASPAAVPTAPIPATNAGGHYVVSLGTYSNAGNAQSLVASLKAKQLPAYAEAMTVAGKPVTRVRIGPFQQRGDAEAARLKAQQVRTDMPASVTALDAAAPAPEVASPATAKPVASPAAAKPAASPAVAVASPAKPNAASTAAAKPTPSPAASGKAPAAAAASPAADKPATPSPAAAGRGYAVQVSAFAIEGQANALRDKLRAAGFVAYAEKVQAESGTRWRVRVGPEADREAADHLRTELASKMNLSGMVVSYP